MANSRYYSSISQQTTLTGGITSSDTTVPVAATTGFPGSLPFTLAIDYGAANEELVEVTAVASLSLTVTRAIDGTSASSHAVGAVVRHVSSARDFTDSRTHEAASTNVHGLSGGAAVVGTTSTQTLTNKTLTLAAGTLKNITVFNQGATGTTTIIGDSANPGTNRLEIKDNESTLNIVLAVNSNGSLKSIKPSGEADNAYRFRMTDSDATTDRFVVLSGGTTTVTPTSTTTFVANDIVLPDTSTTKRAIRVAASGGGTERFTVWNDGRVDIVGTAAGFATLDVTAAASQTAAIARFLDSSSNTLLSVGSDGKLLANKAATIAQPGVTSGIVLTVGGSNAGYTGNLQVWANPSNVIAASVNQSGDMTANSFTSSGAGSFGITTNTTATNITAATGFSTISFSSRATAGVMTVTATVQRTGATITADAAGNITDTLCGTLAAGFRPASGETYIVSYDKGGTADGSVSIASDGTCTLKTLSPTATIASGNNITFTLTFIP